VVLDRALVKNPATKEVKKKSRRVKEVDRALVLALDRAPQRDPNIHLKTKKVKSLDMNLLLVTNQNLIMIKEKSLILNTVLLDLVQVRVLDPVLEKVLVKVLAQVLVVALALDQVLDLDQALVPTKLYR